MPHIRRIGHVVLFVHDVAASADWYCRTLGMEGTTRSEAFGAVFLSFGQRDHDVALFEAPGDRKLGHHDLEHVAFELDGDLGDLKSFRKQLADAGVTITGTVDHGISYGVYFLDPDGHQLEVYFQRVPDGPEAKRVFSEIGAKADPVDLETV